MLGVDPDVQDERSRVKATEVMHDGVSAHMLNRSAGKVCHSAASEACAIACSQPFSDTHIRSSGASRRSRGRLRVRSSSAQP